MKLWCLYLVQHILHQIKEPQFYTDLSLQKHCWILLYMVKFKDFSRPWSVFQILFKANLMFKDFSRQSCIFKYFSSLCEPCSMTRIYMKSKTKHIFFYWNWVTLCRSKTPKWKLWIILRGWTALYWSLLNFKRWACIYIYLNFSSIYLWHIYLKMLQGCWGSRTPLLVKVITCKSSGLILIINRQVKRSYPYNGQYHTLWKNSIGLKRIKKVKPFQASFVFSGPLKRQSMMSV